MNIEEFDRFVTDNSWRYAKTYAKKCPHEYVVRDKLSEQDRALFPDIVRFIWDNGFEAYYFRRKGLYFIHGDYYYWTMEPTPETTTILNRACLADYERINNRWTWKGTDSLKDRALKGRQN